MPLDDAVAAGLVGPEIAALARAQAAWADWYRSELVRLAAVVCGCPPRYTWNAGTAPQASCPLHSQEGDLGVWLR